ncbi:MAG: hypothetical protein PHH38_06905, partial [Candidatus Cloacimonetes bacterium]|nr:hypothetical protein [Candidatus Cloacimonadota bacterium]
KTNPNKTEAAASIEDDIKDIFNNLRINKNNKEEAASNDVQDDSNRMKSLRTDVPSFLKALD